MNVARLLEIRRLQISVRRSLPDGFERIIRNAFDADRHASQFNIARVTFAPDFPDSFGGNPRSGNQYLLNLLFADDLGQRTVSTKNPKTMNQFAVLARVVINETDGSVTKLAIVEQFAQQQFAGIPGAINKHAMTSFATNHRDHL